MALARALTLLALLACVAAVAPPSYGCRRTSTSVTVRSAPCSTASAVTTLAPNSYFHFTGRRPGSSCGDRYDWVEIIWNNQVRYLAAADLRTGAVYAKYCPEMGPDPSPYPTSSKTFINNLARAATAMQRASNVPASVTLAQAILESGWGASTLATKGLNYFGIKGSGPCGSISLQTQEWVNGRYVTVTAAFRKYCTVQQSLEDHAWFFLDNSRYQAAMAAAGNAGAFAQQIAAAGYATSPTYASSLIQLINQYGLTKYDLKTI